MAAALPFVMAASAAVSAIGAIQQGQDAKKAANYNAAVAEQDAIAAQNKAKYDEGLHRERIKALLSKQRAIIGASGADMSGSPLLATIDTIEKGELDALAIRQGGEIESRRYKNQAASSRLEGKSASRASMYKAGSTLLSGASSVASYKAPTKEK
jgi:hypothetical protein